MKNSFLYIWQHQGLIRSITEQRSSNFEHISMLLIHRSEPDLFTNWWICLFMIKKEGLADSTSSYSILKSWLSTCTHLWVYFSLQGKRNQGFLFITCIEIINTISVPGEHSVNIWKLLITLCYWVLAASICANCLLRQPQPSVGVLATLQRPSCHKRPPCWQGVEKRSDLLTLFIQWD